MAMVSTGDRWQRSPNQVAGRPPERSRSRPPETRKAWSDITTLGRRDWVHWIVSAKQAETRERRIRNACDMLAKGKRRPCCFDRSGMYSKSLSCPVADNESNDAGR